ncbi:hypothetical protein [Aureibacter tunicatorum]|uniref:Uncharacterized protein n=1 Tax=Aureibacter tunicatorum TaxID=866807 RepID=A0AAE3XTX7_9BACT|nr:hypothetical protein [Aureibacter tunicatorum]MDR6241816.1 hypothetical protein [Aureibacter tunicatorum]BDD07063.1 hypothetical protein AUTU_45460 [Aureibacter tunicatorum]
MFEQILGNLNDLIVLGLFLYFALVLHGKINVKPQYEERLENFRKKKLSYVIVWGGIFCFTVLFVLKFI